VGDVPARLPHRDRDRDLGEGDRGGISCISATKVGEANVGDENLGDVKAEGGGDEPSNLCERMLIPSLVEPGERGIGQRGRP